MTTAPARADPVSVAAWAFAHDHWWTPAAILRAMDRPHAKVAVKACHSSSKCVAASEYLTLANGRRVQAKDLIGQAFSLLTQAPSGTTIAAAHAAFNEVEPVYAVTTESGRRIVRNAHHPLWVADGVFPSASRCKITPRGWTPISDLSVGTLVAVPERLPIDGAESLPEHEIKALAYLIGDGGYTGSGVIFSQQDGPQLDEFRSCAEALGAHLVHHTDTASVDWRVVGPVAMVATASASPSTVTSHRRNPVADMLRRHGLMGKHSRDKRIPSAIFTLPLEQIRLFLSRLYATDGWASDGNGRNAPVIGFCSASFGLVQDLQELLLRFGVCARIRKAGPSVHAWTLTIQAAADILVFVREIGIFGKEDAVERVRERAARMAQSRQLRVWRHKKAPAGLRWERVASVEPAGVEATVAITVPEYHTYLTTFWEHNTFSAADVVLLALLNGHDVVTTAPTQEQVERLLWGHIRRAIDTSPKIAREVWGNVNLTEIRMPTGEFAVGIATRPEEGGVRFQGHHARPGSALDVVIDEAIGVNPGIFEAVEGFAAGGDVRRLYLCNPTVASGPVYDIFANADPTWERITVDAFDTPNLEGLTLDSLLALPEHELDANVRPYLVTRRWVRDMYHLWGTEHPLWQARVRGQFPDQASNALISLAWLEAARARPAAYSERGGDVTAGIDVAGPGKDETVVYLRQGTRILELHTFPDADSRGRVLQAIHPWLHKGLKRVNVDSAGDGHYFTEHLRDHLPKTVEVNGINVGASPTDTPDKDGRQAADQFANLKAELYWHLREQFRTGMVAGLADQTTISQLASILWAPNSRGKTEIERKDVAAKRGVKSPDRAEALMLCMAPTMADQLLSKAWSGQADRVLSPQEARLPWNRPTGGQEPQRQGWMEGVRWG